MLILFFWSLVQANYADATWKLAVAQKPTRTPGMEYVNQIKNEAAYTCVKLLVAKSWFLTENNLVRCARFTGNADSHQVHALGYLLDQNPQKLIEFDAIVDYIKTDAAYQCTKKLVKYHHWLTVNALSRCGRFPGDANSLAIQTLELMLVQLPKTLPEFDNSVDYIRNEAALTCVKLLKYYGFWITTNALSRCSRFSGEPDGYQMKALDLMLSQKPSQLPQIGNIVDYVRGETALACLRVVYNKNYWFTTEILNQCGQIQGSASGYGVNVVDLMVGQKPCTLTLPASYINLIRNEHSYRCVKALFDARMWITSNALNQCSQVNAGAPLNPPVAPPCQIQPPVCPVVKASSVSTAGASSKSSKSSSAGSSKHVCHPSETPKQTDNHLVAFFSRGLKH